MIFLNHRVPQLEKTVYYPFKRKTQELLFC